jgi:FkbM family methyltransferase
MLKEAIIGTRVGGFALSLRERVELFRAAVRQDESLGRISNDGTARRLIERICGDGKVFVDVGAHIGSVVAGVRRHSSPRKIIAIEAIPEKAAALRRHFPEIEVHSTAAGEHEELAAFFIDLKHSGCSSLDRTLGSRSTVREIQVPVQRLDTVVTATDVDAMKIDVEGAELGVLRGAEKLIASGRPTIMFESGQGGMYPKADLFDWLAQRGYCVVLPNRVAHNDPGLDLSGFQEAHLLPQRSTNYFAIAVERRDEIRDRARAVL